MLGKELQRFRILETLHWDSRWLTDVGGDMLFYFIRYRSKHVFGRPISAVTCEHKFPIPPETLGNMFVLPSDIGGHMLSVHPK